MPIDLRHNVNIEQEDQKTAKKGAAFFDAIGEDGMTIFQGFGFEVDDIRYTMLVTRFGEHV